MVDCTLAPTAFNVDAQDVQPHLPEGIGARGETGSQIVRVNLNLYRCKGAILDNETVFPEVAFALTMALVDTNESLREGADLQWYVFEFFVDNPNFGDIFVAAGLPARLATISMEYSGPQATLAVRVEGQPWYEGTGSHYTTDPAVLTDVMRWIHVSEGQGPTWADYHDTYTLQGVIDGIAWNVRNGFLMNVKPAQAGLLIGDTQELLSKGTITFGRQ